jgi:hypothetical protein
MNCEHAIVWGGLCVECGKDVSGGGGGGGGGGGHGDVDYGAGDERASAATMSRTQQRSLSSAIRGETGGDGRKRIAIMHNDDKLVVTEAEALRMHEQAMKRLLAQRKLILVLDLDLTLIHATTTAELQHSSNVMGRVNNTPLFYYYSMLSCSASPQTFARLDARLFAGQHERV